MESQSVYQLLLGLLDNLHGKLRDEDARNAREFISDGDLDLAFEVICAQLYEYEIPISSEIYAEIDRIGKTLPLDGYDWRFVSKLVR